METAVSCEKLVMRFGDVVAVDGLDLAVRRGECFGLLGPNGAGKTTTVEILEGLVEPTSGEVRLLGRAWRDGPAVLRERLGISLQQTHLPEKLTVRETLTLFRSFYRRGRDVDALVSLVLLDDKRDARVETLSGGQLQRLSVACALAGDPDILFLDEPTTGLDPQSRRMLWDVVASFRARGGTILITTHYMDEAERLCDRVGVIDHGKMIALGSPRELVATLGGAQVIELSANDCAKLDLAELEKIAGVRSARQQQDRVVLTVDGLHRVVPVVLAWLDERSVTLSHLSTHAATLEDVFVHLTGRQLRE